MAELTKAEFDAATRRGNEIGDDVLARAVRYDPSTRTMHVDLLNGASFSFPVDRLQGLEGAGDEDLAAVEILGRGFGLHWEKLDADFTVGGLAAGIFGTAKYMAQQAGRARSEAKAAAARANGAKGGRPRKIARG
ncbi:MAG: DUF2442 domain-containing protein [Rhizobiaceae bacterium]|nr:DUF2442 domain-containing protein [Rhizobiaceae bacterium]